ncbi:feruloyl-CoA synthase [Oryzicola mucosus]|uniref:Feruloyl-CoA synthase n=1 Tax=Oryzicola mucosus TaxID=2767425 RepID=A0A8J6PPF2_9HYPH|nr:feruloyl-CoA synthase [Oryzicola mucosus]MBD0415365.1 feruloyl-CoA synthase [Oryzicola mucosus]
MTEKSVRSVKLWSPLLDWKVRPDASVLVWRKDPLGPYPDKINDRLVHWAGAAPDRTWMADRTTDGSWRRVSYAKALDSVRRLSQALLDFGLSVDRPLVILADNSIEHGLMALAAQHVGIPSAAISPSYATLATDFEKLADIGRQITPGLVFIDSGARFVEAADHAFGNDLPLVALRDPPAGRKNAFSFEQLLQTQPGAVVDEAFAKVGPDTVAKFLFTSGTTGSPKAVIQTQRMLCSNQEMVADCYAYFRDEPPVIVDWAPWNHTAAGNKVFNLVIYNGGTYYIDRGKPTPALMDQTIANLRDISPTWYFNVPAGYEMLVQAMREDAGLRETFFRDLKLMMYAGAGMAQHTWDALNDLAVQTVGQRIPLGTGLGSTETGPFAIYCTEPQDKAGNLGIPAQGVTMKLVPVDDKYELRLKGPNITPGYWRSPKLTAEAFDEEGFYRIGDAVKFAVPGDPRQGFYFDGRIAENFKLDTGTWVAVGKLRAQLVDQFGGLIRDAVIAGENREELGALAVPFMPALRNLAGDADLSDEAVLSHPRVRAELAARLRDHQRQASGSATRVMRLMLMKEAPRFERGEITDKGSLNQRAVLAHRKDLIEALYAGGADVIRVQKEVAA